MNNPIEIIMRMCSKSSLSGDNTRPDGFSKELVFMNLMNTKDANTNITVLYDGNLTNHWVNKYDVKVIQLDGGSGDTSFINQISYIKDQNYAQDTIIYILEDDYLHKKGWPQILREGFKTHYPNILKFDYITLYDHKDKYFYDMYKTLQSKITLSESVHWRTIPSTTNTFAMLYSTFMYDYNIHCAFKNSDNEKFLYLGKAGRLIGSCMPGYSTHCHNSYMSPFFTL